MPFKIYSPDGHVYTVCTEVGNGLTYVRVSVEEPNLEPSLEPADEFDGEN